MWSEHKAKGFTESHCSKAILLQFFLSLLNSGSQWSIPTGLTIDSLPIHCTDPQGNHQLFTSLMKQQLTQSPNAISVFIFHDLWSTRQSIKLSLKFSLPLITIAWPSQTSLQLLLFPPVVASLVWKCWGLSTLSPLSLDMLAFTIFHQDEPHGYQGWLSGSLGRVL